VLSWYLIEYEGVMSNGPIVGGCFDKVVEGGANGVGYGSQQLMTSVCLSSGSLYI
jgi:hypothetical protein